MHIWTGAQTDTRQTHRHLGQRHRNRDRTTDIVARPPGDYEIEAAIVTFVTHSLLKQILGQVCIII